MVGIDETNLLSLVSPWVNNNYHKQTKVLHTSQKFSLPELNKAQVHAHSTAREKFGACIGLLQLWYVQKMCLTRARPNFGLDEETSFVGISSRTDTMATVLAIHLAVSTHPFKQTSLSSTNWQTHGRTWNNRSMIYGRIHNKWIKLTTQEHFQSSIIQLAEWKIRSR